MLRPSPVPSFVAQGRSLSPLTNINSSLGILTSTIPNTTTNSQQNTITPQNQRGNVLNANNTHINVCSSISTSVNSFSESISSNSQKFFKANQSLPKLKLNLNNLSQNKVHTLEDQNACSLQKPPLKSIQINDSVNNIRIPFKECEGRINSLKGMASPPHPHVFSDSKPIAVSPIHCSPTAPQNPVNNEENQNRASVGNMKVQIPTPLSSFQKSRSNSTLQHNGCQPLQIQLQEQQTQQKQPPIFSTITKQHNSQTSFFTDTPMSQIHPLLLNSNDKGDLLLKSREDRVLFCEGKQLDLLQKENSFLQIQLSQKQVQIDSLHQNVSQLQSEISNLQAQIEDQSKQQESNFPEILQASQSQISSLQKQNQQLQKEIQTLQSHLSMVASQNECLQQTKEKYISLESLLENTKSENAQILKVKNENIDLLTSENMKLTEALQAQILKQSTVSQSASFCEDTYSQTAALLHENERLIHLVGNLEDHINERIGSIKKLEEELNQFKREMESQQSANLILEKEMVEKNKQLEEVKTKNREHLKKIESENESKIMQFNSMLQEQNHSRASLEEELRQLRYFINEREGELKTEKQKLKDQSQKAKEEMEQKLLKEKREILQEKEQIEQKVLKEKREIEQEKEQMEQKLLKEKKDAQLLAEQKMQREKREILQEKEEIKRSVKQEKEELQIEVDNMRNENILLAKQIVDIEIGIKKLISENEQLNSVIVQLRNQIKELEVVKFEKEKIERSKAEIEKSQNLKIETQIASLKEKYNQEISSLHDDIIRNNEIVIQEKDQSRINSEKINELTSAIIEQERELKQARKQNQELNELNRHLHELETKLKEEIYELSMKVNEVNKVSVEQTNQLLQEKNEMEQQNHEIVDELQERVHHLENEKQDLKDIQLQQAHESEQKRQFLEQHINELQDKIDELTDKIEYLVHINNELAENSNILQQTNNDLLTKNKELLSSLNKTTDKILVQVDEKSVVMEENLEDVNSGEINKNSSRNAGSVVVSKNIKNSYEFSSKSEEPNTWMSYVEVQQNQGGEREEDQYAHQLEVENCELKSKIESLESEREQLIINREELLKEREEIVKEGQELVEALQQSREENCELVGLIAQTKEELDGSIQLYQQLILENNQLKEKVEIYRKEKEDLATIKKKQAIELSKKNKELIERQEELDHIQLKLEHSFSSLSHNSNSSMQNKLLTNSLQIQSQNLQQQQSRLSNKHLQSFSNSINFNQQSQYNN